MVSTKQTFSHSFLLLIENTWMGRVVLCTHNVTQTVGTVQPETVSFHFYNKHTDVDMMYSGWMVCLIRSVVNGTSIY